MRTFLTLMLCLGLSVDAFAATVPRDAKIYRSELIRTARYFNGLDAPISMYAAQIHQESLWRPKARSKYAHGLAQFTPDTAKWITRYSPEIKKNTPLNAKWALRALVIYNDFLMERVKAIDNCNKRAFALSAYNGGLGWVFRDKKLAAKNKKNRNVWWNSVEKYSPRSKAAYRENRHYVKVILKKHQKLYHDHDWGGPYICK